MIPPDAGHSPIRRIAATAVVVCLACGLAHEASGQAGSDYIAYPRAFISDGNYRTNTRQLTFNRMPGLSPDYRLGAGDGLEVTIIGQGTLERRISASGEITIPLAGSIKVADLTAEEAETSIAEALKGRQLIKDPQVLVYVAEYESKSIYALGEIDRPGEYAVSFQMTLMDLVFLAGGIDFTAGRFGYLHRRSSQGPPDWRPTYTAVDLAGLANQPDRARPGTEVVTIDLQALKDGGVLERNLVLRDGDVFYVPRRQIEFVYVIGEIGSPGAYELPNLKRVTAVQAISWAGGPTRTAKTKDGMVVRHGRDGQRQEFPVDFSAVLAGKRADVEVQPNDIIFIPGSGGKAAGLGFLNAIPQLVTYLLIF